MKKLASKIANFFKSHILFHKNGFLRDFYVMTLHYIHMYLKLFLLSWQNLKWTKMSIWKFGIFCYLKNYNICIITPTGNIYLFLLSIQANRWKFLESIQMAKNSYLHGKKNSHFELDIFCHYKFCHNRRNHFYSGV